MEVCSTIYISLGNGPRIILTDKVILSGMLEKKADWKNEWRARFFVLTVHHIYWAEEEGADLSKQLEIRDSTVESHTIRNKPNVMQFKSSGKKQKVMLLAAASAAELENWIDKITMLSQGRLPAEDPRTASLISSHSTASRIITDPPVTKSVVVDDDDVDVNLLFNNSKSQRVNKLSLLTGATDDQVSDALVQESDHKNEKMSGWLRKQKLNGGGLFKSRFIILRDAELAWFDEESPSAKPKGSLELTPDMITEALDSISLSSALIVSTVLSSETHIFRVYGKTTSLKLEAPDFVTMGKWIVAINAVLNALKVSIAGKIDQELKSLNMDLGDMGDWSQSGGESGKESGRDSEDPSHRRSGGSKNLRSRFGTLKKTSKRSTVTFDADDEEDAKLLAEVKPIEVKAQEEEVKPIQPIAEVKPIQPIAEVKPIQLVAEVKPIQPTAEVKPIVQVKPAAEPKAERPLTATKVKTAAIPLPVHYDRPQTAPVKEVKRRPSSSSSSGGSDRSKLKPIKSARGDIYYIECDDDDDKDSSAGDRDYLCGVCKCS